MTNNSLRDQEHFRKFFDAIQDSLPAYKHRLLTLVAVSCEGFDRILKARLKLTSRSHGTLKSAFRSQRLRAEQIELEGDARQTEEQLVSAITDGFLLPDGLARLEAEQNGRVYSYSQLNSPHADHKEGAVASLVLHGRDMYSLLGGSERQLERELLDSRAVFRSLNEWASHYGLAIASREASSIEVVAERVAWIDEEASSIDGVSAELSVKLAPHLSPKPLRIVIESADPNGPNFREVETGDCLNWDPPDSGGRKAKWKLKLPANTVINCVVTFGGCVQQDIDLAAKDAVPNPARTIVEAVDKDLEHLKRLLFSETPSTGSGRAFESAIHMLLFMLGFRGVHIGAMTHMQKEVDVMAFAPTGGLVLVECKTEVPELDAMEKLWSRTQALRTRLSTSAGGLGEMQIVPVVATPHFLDEFGPATRKYARTNNVVLLGKHELEQLVARTQFLPDADRVVKEWRAAPMQSLLVTGFVD